MGRGRPRKHGPGLNDRTEKALTRAEKVDKVTGEVVPLHELVPETVYLPPTVRGSRYQVRRDGLQTVKLPTVEEGVLRIQENVDPLGQLVAMANGQPIAQFYVDADGEVEIKYETLDLKSRLSLLKYLDGRITPKMSMQYIKHRHEHVSGSEGDRDGWSATVEQAAVRATEDGQSSEG